MGFYYEIVPAERSYRANTLIYSYTQELPAGQIVNISVRSRVFKAFILKKVEKPTFKTKEIDFIYKDLILPASSLLFFKEFDKYYPGTVGATASMFIPDLKNFAKFDKLAIQKLIVKKTKTSHPPKPYQKKIIKEFLSSNTRTNILHGETGSGKTLVYFELTKHMVGLKKSVIILTPEIGLTPQLGEYFFGNFKNVYILHSKLTEKDRREIWLKIYHNQQPVIIIGPRSALFSPVRSLGLVIVDEFHDEAYKQDQNPKYQTSVAAAILTKLLDSKLLLGSATPGVEDFFYAESKGSTILRMAEMPNHVLSKKNFIQVSLNDKDEYSSYPLLSKTLLKNIDEALSQKRQSLIFLNRRGSARTILCQDCGWSFECERCNIPYILHEDKHQVICHTCNSKQSAPSSCKKCSSVNIIYKNPGTKQIEANLRKVFPNAKIARFDKDNTKKETFAENYQQIKDGDIDILVGTQMLIKGHDLPRLSVVGVLLEESGLQFPDFSSAQKNYQIIHQVAGRVGRHDINGTVVLQTYKEKNLTEYKNKSWQEFYDEEIKNRQKYRYPPFCYLLKIEVSRASQSKTTEYVDKITDDIRKNFQKIEIIGPAPALKEKRNNKWFWEIIIKSAQRSRLTEIVKFLPSDCQYDLDPTNLL